jgi:hypothetical protein
LVSFEKEKTKKITKKSSIKDKEQGVSYFEEKDSIFTN